MGTLSRLPVRSLALVLLMTLLPQVALAQNGPPPRAEVTEFNCSGHIAAYVPYDNWSQDYSAQFLFNVFTPDRSWSTTYHLYYVGPGVYEAQINLPGGRDSYVGAIQVPYDNFMLDVDAMVISGCAGGPTIPDPGGDYDVVAQIVAVLISILTAMLGGV